MLVGLQNSFDQKLMFVVTVCFACNAIAYLQTKYLDSIQQVIKYYPARDTLYIKMSHSYSKITIYYESPFYISNTPEAIQVAKKLKMFT
jgi:hypothetical protein